MRIIGTSRNKHTGVSHAILSKDDRQSVAVCDAILNKDHSTFNSNPYSTITCKQCARRMMKDKINRSSEDVLIVIDKRLSDIKVFNQSNRAEVLDYLKQNAEDADIVSELKKHPSESRYAIFFGRPANIVPEVETIVRITDVSFLDAE